jgi:hypothetical protein
MRRTNRYYIIARQDANFPFRTMPGFMPTKREAMARLKRVQRKCPKMSYYLYQERQSVLIKKHICPS